MVDQHMIITVRPSSLKNAANQRMGQIFWQNKRFCCAIGRSGIGAKKFEGDGKTPIGLYPLRRVFYRQDRFPNLVTKLKKTVILPSMGWCDDVISQSYNKLIKLPNMVRHETMWRDDHLYDVVIELGYNDQPVTKNRGSAVFMHLAQLGFRSTEGCVALEKYTMLRLLRDLDVNSMVRISN